MLKRLIGILISIILTIMVILALLVFIYIMLQIIEVYTLGFVVFLIVVFSLAHM